MIMDPAKVCGVPAAGGVPGDINGEPRIGDTVLPGPFLSWR